MDLGVEIDGCFYDMAVCPKADSPIVMEMLGKIPLVYRFVEEGSCFVTDAFAEIERLCKGISIPKELAESMSKGAELGIDIILQQSTAAINSINQIGSCCIDFQDVNQRYIKVEETTKQIKGIAETIEVASEFYIEELNRLRSMLECVMDAVRKELTRLQAVNERRNSLKENLRQATLKYEASKQNQEAYRDAVITLKRCINMIPESMMGPGCKLFEEGETSKERTKNQQNTVDELYRAFHNLNEQIRLREQEFGEDHEIHLRTSILTLEAKSLDLLNAIEFLDSLQSLSVFIRKDESFYTELPKILCEQHKDMVKVEMDSFKSEGIYLSARWATIEKACTDYMESSIVKNYSHEDSDSD